MASPPRRAALVTSVIALPLLGCSSETPAPTTTGTSGSSGSGGGGAPMVGGDRPVELFVPSTYDPATPMPLVLMLHGYGVSGQVEEWIFKLRPEAEVERWLRPNLQDG